MRVCEMCGADISDRGKIAKYCKECAKKKNQDSAKKNGMKNYQKRRTSKKEYRPRTDGRKGRTPAERDCAKQERLEEEKSWELLRQAFGERFGRTHKHVNTMSQLEKDVAEATRLGISYGEYEARKRKGISK